MNSYTSEDVLVLAKRHHNTKRTYLLVNPLQAKHLPVSPSEALKMMSCLGMKIADNYPSAKLVVGFAETATAIAATVAGCLDTGCKYIHTTREAYDGMPEWIYFSEEHSHAVEQKLYSKEIKHWMENSPQIILVDDEISTGKTILNIVEQLRVAFPEMKTKQFIAASIINRLSPEHETRFHNAGIKSEYLVKLSNTDLTSDVAKYDITSAKPVDSAQYDFGSDNYIHMSKPLMNPRFGVDISKYIYDCKKNTQKMLSLISKEIRPEANILILGTEECMYPSLVFGRELEKTMPSISVRCHATTRSPIGICSDPDYPIHSGYKIHSFYDSGRETYIYNLGCYDIAVIITDSNGTNAQARVDLSVALTEKGCQKIVYFEGGNGV